MIEQKQFGDVVAVRLTWPRSQFAGYGVYVFVVRGALIDCGFPGVARSFAKLVRKLSPRGAFITHHHEDHAGNVEQLARLGIPLGMDATTASLLKHPAPIGMYRHVVWKSAPPLTTPVTSFADDKLRLLPTPGHCSNHHSVWDAATGTLFAGDLFLGVKVRIAHASEHPRQHVQSLRAMLTRNPERLFCAHRGHVPNAMRALSDKADWMEELITRVEQRLDAGHDDDEIRRELLGPLRSAHYFSAGDYSPRNLIVSIRNTRQAPVVSAALR
ncbi:MAG: MBL fold metallo-hydrolase [Phycisphaerae bacterium]|nr:MBL fold metallo-hydrolase [Gemmatimonadaceae bacterium]